MQQAAAAMGGRLPHGGLHGGAAAARGDLKNPPGIPVQEQPHQQQQHSTGNQSQGPRQGNQEQQQDKSPVNSVGGQEGPAAAAGGNIPPKFSGSAAPGAERRTSNSS